MRPKWNKDSVGMKSMDIIKTDEQLRSGPKEDEILEQNHSKQVEKYLHDINSKLITKNSRSFMQFPPIGVGPDSSDMLQMSDKLINLKIQTGGLTKQEKKEKRDKQAEFVRRMSQPKPRPISREYRVRSSRSVMSALKIQDSNNNLVGLSSMRN